MRASYLEIYNEDIRDLLSKNPNTKLELKVGSAVDNQRCGSCSVVAELLGLIEASRCFSSCRRHLTRACMSRT